MDMEAGKMQITLIGDVHGQFDRYNFIIQHCENSIQVGDYGAGFVELPKLSKNHRFIRGNHDNPEICRNHPNCIKDGTIEGKIMYIGGGLSIDQAYRTPFVDWWPDEELSYEELQNLIDLYKDVKPEIMITHECPTQIAQQLFVWMQPGRPNVFNSRTANALAEMWTNHQPLLWCFGHHHSSRRERIGRTEFICLDCHETIELDISDELLA